MAIRIRKIKSDISFSGFSYVALCAAKSKQKKGDIYLDDGMHEALSDKFDKDFREMGFINKK